jgi:hypothetical protein
MEKLMRDDTEHPPAQPAPVQNMPKIGCVNHDCDKCKAAAQRQWVGLTEDEVSQIIGEQIGFNSCWGPEEDFARSIEAKLMEKNTWVGLTRWEIDAKLKEKNNG